VRENARYLPKQSFLMRRHYLNNEETGLLKASQARPAVQSNPMTDPTMMTDMLKGNLTNVLPMIVIGGWINWHFSGFVTTKVPFPLTLRFKPMLQRGIELMSLDAAWVSSASWYFLNVFGLRSIYSLVLGENNGKKLQILAFQNSFSSGESSELFDFVYTHTYICGGVNEFRFCIKGGKLSLLLAKKMMKSLVKILPPPKLFSFYRKSKKK
jgi:hypothetical protein